MLSIKELMLFYKIITDLSTQTHTTCIYEMLPMALVTLAYANANCNFFWLVVVVVVM